MADREFDEPNRRCAFGRYLLAARAVRRKNSVPATKRRFALAIARSFVAKALRRRLRKMPGSKARSGSKTFPAPTLEVNSRSTRGVGRPIQWPLRIDGSQCA